MAKPPGNPSPAELSGMTGVSTVPTVGPVVTAPASRTNSECVPWDARPMDYPACKSSVGRAASPAMARVPWAGSERHSPIDGGWSMDLATVAAIARVGAGAPPRHTPKARSPIPWERASTLPGKKSSCKPLDKMSDPKQESPLEGEPHGQNRNNGVRSWRPGIIVPRCI